VAAPAPSAVAAPAAVPAAAPVDDKLAQQLRELNKRCSQLEVRNQEMESTTNRLKAGLQETEATLKRNRVARANLENDVIALQDQLSKARTRNEALEREIQHLGAELERNEDAHNSEIRRMRSNKGERAGEESSPTAPAPGPASAEMEVLRNQMSEKDRLLAQEYEQRATLRSQLEDKQQKYFELKARYDKEKSEWSELLAQALQNQGQLRQQLEEMKAKNLKGWNPFRREK
jgi:chromosome segregation ATPase